MLLIDGAYGEGGGQILRTSLALSLVTGKPFRIEQIRAHRKKPGLGRQHLMAVQAAAQVGSAEVTGNTLGSQTLLFLPGTLKPGYHHFAIGTAGSSTLVFQTILPALLSVKEPSELVLEGGTHNPLAPSFDFLVDAFLPILTRMGAMISAVLDRPGFYPAGGGKWRAFITPPDKLSALELLTRGEITAQRASALVANLPKHIAERELRVIRQELAWKSRWLEIEEISTSPGPGNALILSITSEQITEVFTGFGERGVPAEKVASRTVAEVQEYLAADVPIGRYLADQLILPLALAGGGKFRTLAPSPHTLTNIAVVQQFLPIEITIRQLDEQRHEIELIRSERSVV